MEKETLFSIDDVVNIMEEFKVTHVVVGVNFPSRFGKLNQQEHVKSLGLEIVTEKLKEGVLKEGMQVPYISEVSRVKGLKDAFNYFDDSYSCNIKCPTLEGFRQLVGNLRVKNEELPTYVRGYYQGGIHPRNPSFSAPLSFTSRWTGYSDEYLYLCFSDLDAIRSNGYKHPFRGKKYA